jgi:hypothetical protein
MRSMLSVFMVPLHKLKQTNRYITFYPPVPSGDHSPGIQSSRRKAHLLNLIFQIMKVFNYSITSNPLLYEHATSPPIAQRKFHALKQKNNETASAYISRVDLAVSDLTKLGEPVSHNTWIFTLANGLRPEYAETRKGVNFAKTGFQSVLEVKTSILNEESIYKRRKYLQQLTG